MQLSTTLPYAERGYDRETTLRWCERVDAGPFASLSCGERITGYSQDMRVVLAAAAALTSRVRIVPTLYVLPMHPAVRAAKEIATLDVLSGGRVTVCVGVGGREADYRVVGAPFARRHARMDEQVAEMRRLWNGEPPAPGVDETGPEPVQKGGPPIWAGALGPKAMRRAARWADGVYFFSMTGNPDEVRQGFALAERAWQEAGRDTPPRRVGGFWHSLADDASERLPDYVFRYLKMFGDGPARAIAGQMHTHSVDAVRKAIDGIEAVGCDELFLVSATSGIEEVDRLSDLIARR